MKLQALTLEQCQQARLWRNECLQTLRTPYPLTDGMQAIFYEEVICNHHSPHRYWAVVLDDKFDSQQLGITYPCPKGEFVGMCGLANIQWENRIAEISLIIGSEYRKKDYGKQAVFLLLDEAFGRLNLKTVFGECYMVPGGGHEFWAKVTNEIKTYVTMLPRRKYWDGKYWNSMYFSFDKDDFGKIKHEEN